LAAWVEAARAAPRVLARRNADALGNRAGADVAVIDVAVSVGEFAMLTEIVGEELDAMGSNFEKEIPLATDFLLVEQVAGERFAIEFDEAIGLINLTRLLDGKKPFFHEEDRFIEGVGSVEGNVIYPKAFHRQAA
jgi:hypothetical protein